MAESAVSYLLEQLSVVLRDERKLLGGLKHQVQSTNDELVYLSEFLRVADGKEEADNHLKKWIGQLREISFDVQDVLDEYMLRFGQQHRATYGFKRVGDSVKNLKARHQIASEIKTLNCRLENVVKSQQKYRDMYAVMDQGSSSSTIPESDEGYIGRGDALFLEENDVVGIEKPKKLLLEWIGSMDSGVEVILVVGTGGLGKTTLVKKVYDDEAVKSYFDRHVWVVVSDYKDVKHLLVNLIKKIVKEIKEPPPQGLEDMSIDDLRNFIYEFLKENKYIIVLDDVWKLSTWEALRFALPRKEEESEMLFFKKAFPRNSCPPYLREFADNILKKCDGLPLAIVVIGGVLARKKNRTEEWELFNRSLSHELEGFVKSEKDKVLEEVADEYLNELCSRSLIQVAEAELDGMATKYRIHDLLQDYIASKAREHNIVSIYKGGAMQWPNKIRRLTIQNSVNFSVEANNFEHLRTLVLPNGDMEIGMIKEFLRRCRLLKVLDLGGAPIETIPDEVFKLHHLKHLCLRDTMIKLIPKFIKYLKNLEMLDLENTSVTKLPIEILQLQRLRHLLVYRYDDFSYVSTSKLAFDIVQSFKAAHGIGSCLQSSLQTLDCVDADKIVKEIGKLTQLRVLRIAKLCELRWMKCVIVEKGSLPSLQEWERLGCKLLTEVPQGIEHLTNLEHVGFRDMPNEFMKRVVEEKRSHGDKRRLASVSKVSFGTMTDGSWSYITL
ncbi:hypothetical protein C2S51_036749 [Perilla frutescens var. frutescens]|nr:hypothetical protein C2S51_036749 [Perilla frutescens var. frutescens]